MRTDLVEVHLDETLCTLEEAVVELRKLQVALESPLPRPLEKHEAKFIGRKIDIQWHKVADICRAIAYWHERT